MSQQVYIVPATYCLILSVSASQNGGTVYHHEYGSVMIVSWQPANNISGTELISYY